MEVKGTIENKLTEKQIEMLKQEIKKIRRQLRDVDCDNNDYFWEHLYNDYEGTVINLKNPLHMSILRKFQP